MLTNFSAKPVMNLKRTVQACFLAALCVAGASRTHAAEVDPLDDGVIRLAAAISAFFDKQMLERTTTISGVVDQDSGSDALIYDKLLDQLKTQADKPFTIARSDIIINVRKVKDEISPTTNAEKQIALRLAAEIRSRRSDAVIANIAVPIFGETAVMHLNPTVEVSTDPSVTERQRQKEIAEALENPSAHFLNNQIVAKEGSAFGIEIRIVRERRLVEGVSVVSKSDVCAPKDIDGQAYVELNKGDEYVIRLHNRQNFEVACKVSIDGLSMFAFSEEGNFDSQVVVPSGKAVDVPGWYVKSKATDAFEIGQYANSAAKAKGIPMSGTGTITVSFQACWDPTGHPPDDEFNPKSADSATTRGRRIEQSYEKVSKVIGAQRAVVTVRYKR